MKALSIGIFLLAVSALNVYLPDVGNALDAFRLGFSLIAFFVGWFCIITSIMEYIN